MSEPVTFGMCLNALLLARGWSASRLAKELNVDPSYIRRWIRGDRVPSIKSNYVKEICLGLCSGLGDISGKKLGEAYKAVLEELGVIYRGNLNTAIEDCLIQAQYYSLGLTNEERMAKSYPTEEDLASLTMKINRVNKSLSTYNNDTSYGSESSIPAVINGRKPILYAAISLLKAASNSKNSKKGDMVITFQSENYPFDGYPELEESFQDELSSALGLGWRMWHILKLSCNLFRSIGLAKKIIELVGFDKKYIPVYLEPYGLTLPASEVLIVQGTGALLCFSTEDVYSINTALYINTPDVIEALLSHYILAIKTAKPLINIMSLDKYFLYVTDMDKKIGSRYVIRNDIDGLTIPLGLWKKYIYRTMPESVDRESHIQRISSRLDCFHEQIKFFRFINVFPMEAVEYSVDNVAYIYDNIYRLPSLEDIIEHFENIVYLLETYENFEIGLISDSQKYLIPSAFYEIKEDTSVVIDMWYQKNQLIDENNPGVFLSITEGSIIEAFTNSYREIWDKITPAYKDKSFIIPWFKNQIKRLEGKRRCE